MGAFKVRSFVHLQIINIIIFFQNIEISRIFLFFINCGRKNNETLINYWSDLTCFIKYFFTDESIFRPEINVVFLY